MECWSFHAACARVCALNPKRTFSRNSRTTRIVAAIVADGMWTVVTTCRCCVKDELDTEWGKTKQACDETQVAR
eukprot:4570023-Amphidinium_carterae.1